MTSSRPENCDAPGGLARLPRGPTTREKAARHTQTDPHLGPLLRRGAGSFLSLAAAPTTAASRLSLPSETEKPPTCGGFATPRVGLEPTTLRLTAGCSAN